MRTGLTIICRLSNERSIQHRWMLFSFIPYHVGFIQTGGTVLSEETKSGNRNFNPRVKAEHRGGEEVAMTIVLPRSRAALSLIAHGDARRF